MNMSSGQLNSWYQAFKFDFCDIFCFDRTSSRARKLGTLYCCQLYSSDQSRLCSCNCILRAAPWHTKHLMKIAENRNWWKSWKTYHNWKKNDRNDEIDQYCAIWWKPWDFFLKIKKLLKKELIKMKESWLKSWKIVPIHENGRGSKNGFSSTLVGGAGSRYSGIKAEGEWRI